MARALLKRSKVVLLDEATASVDYATDVTIQHAIRTEFQDSTVLTIAHRIKTVMDYDRILVLDKGSVVEYGRPHELLQAKGTFWGICSETGEMEDLVKIAQEKEAADAHYK